jgi:uncharacterized membrane-anchored protein
VRTKTVRDHEHCQVLNDEIHGRPGLAVLAPARLTHRAFTLPSHGEKSLVTVTQLYDGFGVKPPQEGARHHSVELASLLFKCERQGEFHRISLTTQSSRNEHEAISLLPLGWIDQLPGKRLAAIHTEVMSKNMKAPTADLLKTFLAMTTWPAPM